MNYEHKGIAISFYEADGEFGATVAGEHITAPSLAAIKKKIDKANMFVPFTALRIEYSNRPDPFTRVTVVGIRKGRERKYGGRDESTYRLDIGGEAYASHLYTDTPENEALLAEKREVDNRYEAERRALDAKHTAENKAVEAKLVRLPKPEVK